MGLRQRDSTNAWQVSARMHLLCLQAVLAGCKWHAPCQAQAVDEELCNLSQAAADVANCDDADCGARLEACAHWRALAHLHAPEVCTARAQDDQECCLQLGGLFLAWLLGKVMGA